MTLSNGYIRISTDYAYAQLRIGLSLMRLHDKKEVYFQPGGYEDAIRRDIAALSDLYAKLIDKITHMTIGGYFND